MWRCLMTQTMKIRLVQIAAEDRGLEDWDDVEVASLIRWLPSAVSTTDLGSQIQAFDVSQLVLTDKCLYILFSLYSLSVYLCVCVCFCLCLSRLFVWWCDSFLALDSWLEGGVTLAHCLVPFILLLGNNSEGKKWKSANKDTLGKRQLVWYRYLFQLNAVWQNVL